MLIKLLPSQLVKIWDMLRFAIAETFMPRNTCTAEHFLHILTCLLAGKMQCWVAFSKTPNEDGSRKFIGFLITRIAKEFGIGERVLSIDHIYAFSAVDDEIFKTGLPILFKFAAKNQCKALVALTENPRVPLLAGKLGFSRRDYLFQEVPNG